MDKTEELSRTAEIADRLKTIDERLEKIEALIMAIHAQTLANLAQAQGAPIPEECLKMLKEAIRKTS